MMKLFRFSSGLGNQLLQYSYYLYLKQKKYKLLPDLSHRLLKNHQGFELFHVFPKVKNILKPANTLKVVDYILFPFDFLLRTNRMTLFFYFTDTQVDRKILVDAKIKKYQLIIDGCFVFAEHIHNVETELRESLTFRPIDINDELNYATQLSIAAKESVGVHVRRGDYYSQMYRRKLGDICDINYYLQAIEIIDQKIENPVYYIFSNDFDWVKANFPKNKEYVLVNWNTGKNSFRDMQLMSYCKHQIIANSTFSWWAAWLNSKVNAIKICPSKWVNTFNDLTAKSMVLKESIEINTSFPYVSLLYSQEITNLQIQAILTQSYSDFELLILPKYLVGNSDLRVKSIEEPPSAKHILHLDEKLLQSFAQPNRLDQLLKELS